MICAACIVDSNLWVELNG